ncbi:MAG: hypothetical protein OEV43_02270 [Coriobacteriia bacterium]|nr:hypothetical protein [Coriobacteriia bacterium]
MEIERVRLAYPILESTIQRAFLIAPAGYGKTVLARQVMESTKFEKHLWIDCRSADKEGTQLLEQVLRSANVPSLGHQHRSTLLPSITEADVEGAVHDALRRLGGSSLCLVLDDLPSNADENAVDSILRAMDSLDVTRSLLVVTSRSPFAAQGQQYGDFLVLDSSSLSLDREEMTRLLACQLGEEPEKTTVDALYALSEGQPALASLLSRYCVLGRLDDVVQGRASAPDLAGLLERTATEQLTPTQLSALYMASLLRSGGMTEIVGTLAEFTFEDICAVSTAIPLFALDEKHGIAARFRVHDLAAVTFAASGFAGRHVPNHARIRRSAIRVLQSREDYERALELLLVSGNQTELLSFLVENGEDTLARGSAELLCDALGVLDSARLLATPALLLLQAKALRDLGELANAIAKAAIARDLAECDGDNALRSAATLLVARLHLDQGEFEAAISSLDAFVRMACARPDSDDTVLAHAYLGTSLALVGELEAAAQHVAVARGELQTGSRSAEISANLLTMVGFIVGYIHGRWDEVQGMFVFANAWNEASVPASLLMKTESNRAAVLVDVGRLEAASGILQSLLESKPPQGMRTSVLGNAAAAMAGQGEYGEAVRMIAECDRICVALSDHSELHAGICYSGPLLRACGDAIGALERAERALELCRHADRSIFKWLAVLEIAASQLALGNPDAALARASSIRAEADHVPALYTMLRADMILAEIARREGRVEDAVNLLRRHEDYILTESSNWQVGMYVRSFPHLLGLLAEAIDPSRLPAHLLRMVLPRDAERTLLMAREVMQLDRWFVLADRIVGADEAARLNTESTLPVCEVRFFGGLDVTVGDRVVPERAWRKRKARLLFAIAALDNGHDIPREKIYEHLWPDMDEERARNNYYVVWSAMKAALLGSSERGTPFPYVQNAGNVCRTESRLVHTDVADFDGLVADARVADERGDVDAAVAAYERIAGLYRGDLLPGDVYEDWFQPVRDHCRQQFADCMHRAGELLLSRGKPLSAARLLRQAIAVDSWREDLYQILLRCQIAVGQRSAAIETYVACRVRLGDDLGIDPSSETKRLYEQILAMEDTSEDSEDVTESW